MDARAELCKLALVPFLALSFCGSSFSPQIQGHLGTKATKDSDFAMGTAPSRHIEISEAGLGVGLHALVTRERSIM
jgi:hypothetical protein